jgi:phosphate/sulfate permease
MRTKVIVIICILGLIILNAALKMAVPGTNEVIARTVLATLLGFALAIILSSDIEKESKQAHASDRQAWFKAQKSAALRRGTIAEMILKYRDLLAQDDIELVKNHYHFGRRNLCPGCRNYWSINVLADGCGNCPSIIDEAACTEQEWMKRIDPQRHPAASEIRAAFEKRLQYFEDLYKTELENF